MNQSKNPDQSTVHSPQSEEAISPTTLRTQNDARFDDATIQRKTQNYPEEAREPVMWLAAFIREFCAGRFDILCDRAKAHGFKTVTENYFYRVLTGRYFNVGGDGKVLGSAQNLLQIVDKLRAGVQLAQRAGKTPFIETSTYRTIADLIDGIRAPEAICKFAVIIGPTGGQKTASAKHYCHLNNHGACVHVEAPETPTLSIFLTDLAVRYGHSKWAHNGIKRRNITDSVNDKKLIIVDNVQRMYVPGRGGNQPVFSFLQKLQDDTGCAIVFMFAQDRADFLTAGFEKGFFEQFEGRAGGRDNFLVMDDYTPREDLGDIAKAYGLSDGKQTIDYLEELSRKPGRIRILFDTLQKARRIAGKAPLTLAHVRAARGEDRD